MAVAPAERGLKRICMNCGTRFYDMNKRPIICPSCAMEYNPEAKVKTRRSKVDIAAEEDAKVKSKLAAETTSEDMADENDDDIISLDDAKDLEDEDGDDDDLVIDLDADTLDDDLDEGLDDDDDDLDDPDLKVNLDKDDD